jgi:hypothetical protein
MRGAVAEFSVYPFGNRLATAALQQPDKIILGNKASVHEILKEG